MRPILMLTALLGCAAAAAPALAQDSGGDKVNQIIVFGDDACPVSEGADITVCARKAEQERYRIPEMFRGSDSPSNEAWTEKVLAYETVGRTGTLSCSPVGPGGSTGCLANMINKAYQEKLQAPDVKFAELVAAERAKRLSTIDATSAEDQARVEVLEKEYEAKLRAEDAARDAADAGARPPPIPPRS